MCEILAPAGNKENLINAINAGADAVYLGLKDFSARKSADNFDFDELKYAVAYAKAFDVKVYLTVNTLIKDSEINDFLRAINQAYSCGVDAFILQDIFLGKYIKDIMPNAVLHLSTQAGICNEYGAKLAKRYGFSRVILARETKISDIEKITKIIETEVFIQGALCTSYSGHCYFSSFVGGNSGNRGYCKQPCRKEYKYVVNGKTVKNGYLLSLSDLCIGEDITVLKNLGVKSFKIEGRMRGKEYVSSAILYYKSLLNGKNDKKLFENLKISFNRGDYTKGLAVAQDKNFISYKVQNNIGLDVGTVKSVSKSSIFLNSFETFSCGDAFKILRNGYEVATATVIDNKIKYKGDVKVGDTVRLTKKANLFNTLNVKEKKLEIDVLVDLQVGKKLKLFSNDVMVETESEIVPSINSPTTKSEIINNLNKTDIYPYNVRVKFISFDENAFVPKSVLNKLRAELYFNLFYKKTTKKPYIIEQYKNNSTLSNTGLRNKKSAVIVSDLYIDTSGYNEVILAPYNYNNLPTVNTKNVWLYLPPYLSGKDISIIKDKLSFFKGVYADGVWAIELCRELNVKLFAGVGFNVFNSLDVIFMHKEGINEICASKELSIKEIKDLNSSLYVLSDSPVEIMDLIYCPFSKNCKICEVVNDFKLIDKDNRTFVVKRYKISECRFKVYNMAKLKRVSECNQIADLTVEGIKDITQGNYVKGVK